MSIKMHKIFLDHNSAQGFNNVVCEEHQVHHNLIDYFPHGAWFNVLLSDEELTIITLKFEPNLINTYRPTQ